MDAWHTCAGARRDIDGSHRAPVRTTAADAAAGTAAAAAAAAAATAAAAAAAATAAAATAAAAAAAIDEATAALCQPKRTSNDGDIHASHSACDAAPCSQ